MRRKTPVFLALAGLLALYPVSAPVGAQEQKPTVKIPEAGVPQIMTLEGMYVRAAYNNEGYAIIGYKTANMSVGEEWMLLEMGTTVREGVPSFSMKRDDLSLETPDGDQSAAPVGGRLSQREPRRAQQPRKRRARLDQLLSTDGVAGVPHRLLQRPEQPCDVVGAGRGQSESRVPRPHLSSRCQAASNTASTGSTCSSRRASSACHSES